MREMAIDISRRLSGGECRGGEFRALDETGREIRDVYWVDAQKCEYGQLVMDEDGHPQIDPESPGHPWVITRIGKLKVEQVTAKEGK